MPEEDADKQLQQRDKNNECESNWKKDSMTSLLICEHVWYCAWLLISNYPATFSATGGEMRLL